MDFGWTEEQDGARLLARQIFTEHGTQELLRQAEAGADHCHWALWRALARAGLLGVALPEEVGGEGLGFLALCALLEEHGRAVAPVPLWATLVLGALPVARFGSAEQRRRLLPGVVQGECVLSAALEEEEITWAAPDGPGYRLRGVKTCVPAAHLAALVLVPARLQGGGTRLFLVDQRGEGVTLERQISTTGEPLHRMVLHGAPVTAADQLGGAQGPGDHAGALAWIEQRALVGLCATESGVAQRQVEMVARYTSQRQQFGRPIASFQAVAQRAADAFIASEAVRLTALQAAWRLEAGAPAAAEVALAKYWAAEGGQQVAAAAQHLHGGMGFDRSYPLYRYYLWSRQIALSLGGGGSHLALLGALLAQEAG